MSKIIDLKDFVKLDKIGEGCFSKAFRVREISTGNIYAATVSRYELDDQTNLKLFKKRELNIFAQFTHPSILKCIGYSPLDFKEKPNPVIIAEFCQNGNLKDIINLEKRSLSPPAWNDTKKLINLYGIASAMSFLHENDYIHRDLKPDNIFEDEYLYPKIGDFGLGKHISKEGYSTQSLFGFKGSYLYSPPETIEDESYYSKAGDVYAFGMISYQLITNLFPFPGKGTRLVMNKLLRGERPEFTVPIPNCYKNLITKCWSQNENERPSFDEIVHWLENEKEFITDTVDEDEFLDYVQFIKSQGKTFNPDKKIKTILPSLIEKVEESHGINSSDRIKEPSEILKRKEDIKILKKCIESRTKENTLLEEQVYKENDLGSIVLVTSEIGVFTKIGDMSKMIWELAKELAKMGLDVNVISPYYNENIEGQTDYLKKYGIKFVRNIEVFVSKPYQIGVHYGVIENVKCWFIHHFELFSKPYPQGSNSYKFDIMLTMADACLEMIYQFFEKMPRLIVTNDWLTGLIPAFAKIRFEDTFGNIIFMHTIHCLEQGYRGKIYQKEDEPSLLDKSQGLPEKYIYNNNEKCIDPSQCALMASDQWATTSIQYRKDLLESSPYKKFLQKFPHPFAYSTGIDVDEHKKLLENTGIRDDAKKYIQYKYFHSEDDKMCLFLFIGDFSDESGVLLIVDCFDELVKKHENIQFIVGIKHFYKEPSYLKKLEDLNKKYPRQFRSISEDFCDDIASIYAADYLIIPRLFEPSGILQQEAFASECPVIAFKTGGLSDTVFEYDKEKKTGNGLLFWCHKNKDFMMAIDRAYELFQDKPNYYKMCENAYNSVLSVEKTAVQWANEFTRLMIESFENSIK